MQFPFETTTKNGQKATVLGTMPDGRLIGHIMRKDGACIPWGWDADGSYQCPEHASITLPLQIRPLTTYRMRNGGIVWTSGLIINGWIHGITDTGFARAWLISNGRWSDIGEHPIDLIEELPPGTTA